MISFSGLRPAALLAPRCMERLYRAAAAQAYPAKPMQLIVPFSAGGDADMAARNLPRAQAAGAAVVVVNKAGANGAIGSAAVKQAAPDGYHAAAGTDRFASCAAGLAAQDHALHGGISPTLLLELNPVVCVGIRTAATRRWTIWRRR